MGQIVTFTIYLFSNLCLLVISSYIKTSNKLITLRKNVNSAVLGFNVLSTSMKLFVNYAIQILYIITDFLLASCIDSKSGIEA